MSPNLRLHSSKIIRANLCQFVDRNISFASICGLSICVHLWIEIRIDMQFNLLPDLLDG